MPHKKGVCIQKQSNVYGNPIRTVAGTHTLYASCIGGSDRVHSTLQSTNHKLPEKAFKSCHAHIMGVQNTVGMWLLAWN